jgi:hypothetical protein
LHDLGGLQLVVVVVVVVSAVVVVVVVENNANFLPRQAVQFEVVVVVVVEGVEGPEEQYQEVPTAWQQLPRL